MYALELFDEMNGTWELNKFYSPWSRMLYVESVLRDWPETIYRYF